MGSSARGILAYGYDLGGPEDGWKVRGADRDGYALVLDWYSDDVEGAAEDTDFADLAETMLLTAAGFDELDPQAEGYLEREREAKARIGVKVGRHCSGGYPMYLLTAKVITVHQGQTEALDLAALAREPTEQGWDGKLAAALLVLGITPTQERPAWLLCSYWG